MPYLDNWSSAEEDYSSSLTGVTKALQDASLRLPITGNVKADVKDLKEVFDSIMNIFSCLSPCVQRFVPKGEVVEDVISNLAELVSTERALIEECGSLLSQAHNLQMTECSLRGQLIQSKRSAGA
ncbi:uncharacterized protein A4U43_C01F34840 [Asparagus officinalis]|uniref:Uncharacterized protein n=1 Tax=Asparagus officinalis TaxID=4686 RepID=A0A5P1FUH9_ASPOF|nr:protein ENDOSPERM DEFECTIVE 1-like [Asparagus officinalis]ONK81976.1 uncharacterized protein A4U43_C01F34840 [Asparagus officinalis]